MSCEVFRAKALHCCAKSLKIGTIAVPGIVWAVFKNESSTNIFALQASSDGSGLVTVDLPESGFPTKQPYSIHLCRSLSSIFDSIEFSVGSQALQRVETRFERFFDAAGNEAEVLQAELVLI